MWETLTYNWQNNSTFEVVDYTESIIKNRLKGIGRIPMFPQILPHFSDSFTSILFISAKIKSLLDLTRDKTRLDCFPSVRKVLPPLSIKNIRKFCLLESFLCFQNHQVYFILFIFVIIFQIIYDNSTTT